MIYLCVLWLSVKFYYNNFDYEMIIGSSMYKQRKSLLLGMLHKDLECHLAGKLTLIGQYSWNSEISVIRAMFPPFRMIRCIRFWPWLFCRSKSKNKIIESFVKKIFWIKSRSLEQMSWLSCQENEQYLNIK